MTTSPRIAVVTGANRGLGFETCRQLGRLGYHVVPTSRDRAKGLAATDLLIREGVTATHHQLDVTDATQIARLAEFLATRFGRADVLINNAAIYLDEGRSVLKADLDSFRKTMATNVYGPLALSQAVVPLMRRRRYGRIVNVSSGSGQLASMRDDTPAYAVSKAALNAVTLLLADAVGRANILVNSVCPVWVRTDMGGPHAPRTVEAGASTIVWLATLPDGGPTGGFFRDRRRIPW